MNQVDRIIQSACGRGPIGGNGIRSLMWSTTRNDRKAIGRLTHGVPPALVADVLIFEFGPTMAGIHSMIKRNLRVH
jgi:hypothetical protein